MDAMTYKVSVIIFVTIINFSRCFGVIYQLNESEYKRMPPLFVLDEYEDCLSEDDGMYCMVLLQLQARDDNPLMRMIREYSMYDVKHYNHSNIDRGICVRKTCGKYINKLNMTVDLPRSLETCLNESIWREYRLEAKLTSLLYCDRRDEPMDVNTLDRIVMWLILGIVALNVVGSCYDYFLHENQKGNKLLLCFSITQNWRFLSTTKVSQDVKKVKTRHLTSLHGIKTILCVLIILAHVYFHVASGFTSNTLDYEKTYDYPWYHIIYSGLAIVQIFFFISGFLLAYNLHYLELSRKLTAWDIPKVTLWKISRLTPVLVFILAISVTWVRHMGSGPLWKQFVTGSLVADCQRYWWHTLLYFNNYMPDNKFCIIPTWHLAAEMQVFLIGLLAYVLPTSGQRRRVLGALLLLGSLSPAIHVLLQNFDAIVIMKPEFYRTLINPTYRLQHILGHNNLPCYIIGMFTADRLHRWYENGSKLSNNRWTRCFPYLSIASIVLLFYSGRVFYVDGDRASVIFRMLYSTVHKPLLGLICSVGLLALIRTNTYLRSVLECRGAVVASRLSYCVFLLHMLVVHVSLGLRHRLATVSFVQVTIIHLTITMVSFILSVPIYLMVEAPFARISSMMRENHTDCQPLDNSSNNSLCMKHEVKKIK